MRKKINIALILTLAFLIIVVVLMYNNTQTVNDPAIELIKKHRKGDGRIIDYSNKLGYEGPESIKFFYGDTVELHFGYLKMVWSKEDFLSEKNRKDLESIGFTMNVHPDTNRLILYYNDEEVQRWVKP